MLSAVLSPSSYTFITSIRGISFSALNSRFSYIPGLQPFPSSTSTGRCPLFNSTCRVSGLSNYLKSSSQAIENRPFSYEVLRFPSSQPPRITIEEFNLLESILKKCVAISDNQLTATERKTVDNFLKKSNPGSEIPITTYKVPEFTVQELDTLDSILKKCIITFDKEGEQPKISCNLWPTGIININPERLADHLEDLFGFVTKFLNDEGEYVIICLDKLITGFADKDNPKDDPYKNGYERASVVVACLKIAGLAEEKFKNKNLSLKSNENLTGCPLQQFHIPYAFHNNFSDLSTAAENLKKHAQYIQLNKARPQLL